MNLKDLCETMTPQPWSCDIVQALTASVIVPIWFTLRSRPEQAFFSMPVLIRSTLVT
jgi:hypothetical protein